MNMTIHQLSKKLHTALTEYIEATYHIDDPALLQQRRQLLEATGVIHQEPFLESTPRYTPGKRFADIEGLHAAARQILELLSKPTEDGKRVLFDPPYQHQSDALSRVLVEAKNIVIMTGTGSGKTESFLMPILGKLAIEASNRPQAFETEAMRALILYPMNALVNDQLGRLRGIFGDSRVVEQFKAWCGRPPRFARYTSRTPYPGVREKNKDQRNYKDIRDFYVQALEDAEGNDEVARLVALKRIQELKSRGKWPAKSDLRAWYYGPNRHWQDGDENYQRAVMLLDDSELITRHEIQAAPPDLLVTNYSMLEYMLMRPIERPIFDCSRQWLKENPSESFLIVLDEAHLYKGAGGAEVGLLLRRLRERLDIPARRMQAICATASFSDVQKALSFASDLTGTDRKAFSPVTGKLLLRLGERAGTIEEANALASFNGNLFHSENGVGRIAEIRTLLTALKIVAAPNATTAEALLFYALSSFGPLELLINVTMKRAQPVRELSTLIFPDAQQSISEAALTTLADLASCARLNPGDPSLLPCRVHNFFRGLRGLWVCLDQNCSVSENKQGIVAGQLFTQPRSRCDCGAIALELFTCRICGTAYARGYCENPESPTIVWSEPGSPLRMDGEDIAELKPIDILLSKPYNVEIVEETNLDLIRGELFTSSDGRIRNVHLAKDRIARAAAEDDEDEGASQATETGLFHRCAVCEKHESSAGTPTIQDHETKGDQPFQILVNKQIELQPPGPQPATTFAPLRGRKVLAFSDSRQVAARLAPQIQGFSARDILRPLIVHGWQHLQKTDLELRLDDLYCAVLIAAAEKNVRLRPELAENELFTIYEKVVSEVATGLLESTSRLRNLCSDMRSFQAPPDSLLSDVVGVIRDKLLGLEALAIASIVERSDHSKKIANLPNIPGVTETEADRLALARAWLREWQRQGFWLLLMGKHWRDHANPKVRVTTRSPKFKRFIGRLPDAASRKVFKEKWLKDLLDTFTDNLAGKHELRGRDLSLEIGGQWVRCADCKSVHRPIRLLNVCLDCGHPSVRPLNPETDDSFDKRKGFYRRSIIESLSGGVKVLASLVAAEHTAQLNSAQRENVFSKAEMNELLFQDVEIQGADQAQQATAIDLLSSTTTMEVGIDIGQLTGVALRNMPPSRANYQQRAGRAGRRANAIASVIAFGGSDTHDEHYFSNPKGMISGEVVDPTLGLDNKEITKRHVRAFLLQTYHQARIPEQLPGMSSDLFSVLGKVGDFMRPKSLLNRADFEQWLTEQKDILRARAADWIPAQLTVSDREDILNGFGADCLSAIDRALPDAPINEKVQEDQVQVEDTPELGDDRRIKGELNKNLLDTLLYHGVLPRYAFPTDVATFHIFDTHRSDEFRPVFEFAPSQGLAIALTQYAPGKMIWVAGKCYMSGAIYNPIKKERYQQWRERRLHLDCRRCGYSHLVHMGKGVEEGQLLDCPACSGHNTFGPAKIWFRPTGFAHPAGVPPITVPDELPITSYATRAKLTMSSDNVLWLKLNDRIRYDSVREHLLVSNTGPSREGYSFCSSCGCIEAAAEPHPKLFGRHRKPYPDKKSPDCAEYISKNVVLGTDFITDVALFSFKVEKPMRLLAADTISQIALRTVCEALARAATNLLEIEANEIMAEFRPALTEKGVKGYETEIFLYDTLSGGAGYSKQAAEKGMALFEEARKILLDCKDQCDMSCYRCLRTFRNRLDHGLLDRHIGVALLDYFISGVLPVFSEKRLRVSTDLLIADLIRQPGSDTSFEKINATAQGQGPLIRATNRHGNIRVISVGNPLFFDGSISTAALADGVVPMIEVNELRVQKSLGDATLQVLQYVSSA